MGKQSQSTIRESAAQLFDEKRIIRVEESGWILEEDKLDEDQRGEFTIGCAKKTNGEWKFKKPDWLEI